MWQVEAENVHAGGGATLHTGFGTPKSTDFATRHITTDERRHMSIFALRTTGTATVPVEPQRVPVM